MKLLVEELWQLVIKIFLFVLKCFLLQLHFVLHLVFLLMLTHIPVTLSKINKKIYKNFLSKWE